MSKWRVRVHMDTTLIDDRSLVELVSRQELAGKAEYNRPYDHVLSTETDNTQHLVADVQFTNQTDAELFFGGMKRFAQTKTLPVGVGRVGDALGASSDLHGKITLCLCTHEDTTVVPCSTNGYQEHVF